MLPTYEEKPVEFREVDRRIFHNMAEKMECLQISTDKSLKALQTFIDSGKLSYLDLNPESTYSTWKQHPRYKALC